MEYNNYALTYFLYMPLTQSSTTALKEHNYGHTIIMYDTQRILCALLLLVYLCIEFVVYYSEPLLRLLLVLKSNNSWPLDMDDELSYMEIKLYVQHEATY